MGEYEKETLGGGEMAKVKRYMLRQQHCVVASDDRDKCLARKTLKKTRFEAN